MNFAPDDIPDEILSYTGVMPYVWLSSPAPHGDPDFRNGYITDKSRKGVNSTVALSISPYQRPALYMISQ